MSNYINPASNISYTNRDFATVYPELLNLTKELTSRWDPSIANESDPGLVLLKLDAILADKLSYNIDKNILEAFPMSLTQMSSAQRLYSILGYNMHWYNSAWTTVNLQWTGDASDDYVSIPAFTMVTNDAGSIVYTLIGKAKGSYEDLTISPSDVDLYFKNDTINKFYAYQGIATKHDIHGDNIIRITDLDSNNRIYLGTTNIAQNGVFICNTTESGTKSYDWTRVDNLVVEKLGEKHFQFGVSDDLYSCYLEFPEDAENLIKDGIEIVYLQTMGELGNIAATKLTKFYADLYLTSKVNETTVSLNSNNMVISNTIAGTGGQDPETINEAYKNYRKTVGTFNTLVTLRDYINAALQSGLCSNCFICDKTNDVQASYDVKSIINGVDTIETIVEATQSTVTGEDIETGSIVTVKVDNPSLSSIDLKIYALEPHEGTDKITTMAKFLNTFELKGDTTKIKTYLSSESYKHIGIDFQELVSTTYDSAHPCLFKNAYIITARVYCKKTGLTDSDKEDIKNNIQIAFYNNLNAACLNFGESIATDLVTSVIQNADSRIKSVYVDTISYDTVAVIYYETATCPYCASLIRSDELIKSNYHCPHCNEPISTTLWNSLPDKVGGTADISLAADTIDYISDYGCDYYSSTHGQYDVDSFVLTATGERKRCIKSSAYLVDSCWVTDEYEFSIDYDKFTKKIESDTIGQINYGTRVELKTDIVDGVVGWTIKIGTLWVDISEADLESQYGIVKTAGKLFYDNSGLLPKSDTVIFEISKGTQIRDEVYVKSILAGKTPLFKTNEDYIDYNFPNPFCETISDVAEIEAIADITFSRQSATPFLYDMRANEVAEFYNTQFNEFINYSNYVKYEAKLGSDIVPNQDRELGADEYIIFYYKNTNNSGELYQYHAYGKGAILNSSFTISASSTHTIGDLIVPSSISGWKSTTVAGFTYIEVGSDITRSLSTSESTMIEGLTSQIIKGTNSVSMKQPSQVALNGSAYCYWILNSVQNGAFVLFDAGETHRTLQNGEYFLYADSALSEINVFGQGTTIIRSDPTNRIDCPIGLSYEELIDSSLILYTDMFVHPEASDPLICQTNDVAYMSYGCSVKLQLKESGGQVNTTIDKLIVSHDGVRCELKYTATGTATLSIVENPENGNVTKVLVNGTAHTSWTYAHGTGTVTTGTLTFNSSVPAAGDTVIICVSENLLKYFKIQYRNSEEAEWSELTDISLTGSGAQFGWNALSVLNINIGQSVGQALYSGQTVNLYSDDGQLLRTFTGQDSVIQTVPAINDGTRLSLQYTYNQLPVKIYSDLSIMTSSSGRYSIVTQERTYAHISQTKQNFTSVPTQMSPLLNGGVTLTIKAAASGQAQCNTVICPAQFDTGNYLTKMSNASKDFNTLTGQFVSKFEYLQSGSSTQSVFYLTHTPTSLTGVKVNNQVTTEWVYSKTAGTLTFNTGHIPTQGAIIEVEYPEKCNLQLTQVETGDGTKKIFAINDNPPSVTRVYVNNVEAESGWSYSNVTHKLTFTSAPVANAVVRIQYPIANLSIIYNGVENLVNCNNTPVKFTIPSLYSGKEIFLQMSATFSTTTEMVDNATIIVGNPQRYIYNPEIPENRVDSYEALVRKLDINHHFNYTYEPTENEIIRNPLNSSSFLNANHPFYANTICEYIGDAQTTIDVQENK